MLSEAGHYIAGQWRQGRGEPLVAVNPSTGLEDWRGRNADGGEIDAAVAAARGALEKWAVADLSCRIEAIESVVVQYQQHKPAIADCISRATGKPRWEALTEVDAMIAKGAISIAAERERRSPSSRGAGAMTAVTRFVPIGVMAVLGPFNMPGHLPNGHLIPVVLAGNTVVFKPSELTPGVGEMIARLWHDAGIPPGVLNLLQGAAATGAALAAHHDVDGVLFTGSAAGGAAIHRALAGEPHKMLALEMGGNNPLIVWDCADVTAAAYCVVQSAFITSGQRCGCARRLIVAKDAAGDALVARLVEMMRAIGVGLYMDDPEPFMGTVISAAAAERLLRSQQDLMDRGGTALAEMKAAGRSPALLMPGLIDVTGIARRDEEIFGPLLQVIRVDDFAAALQEASATWHGLTAGLISDRGDLFEQFRRVIRAGVVNFNRPLTGARSDQPFGGLGRSGNHRPGAYFAADYCSDSVAAVEDARVTLPVQPSPGIHF
jgi:succinylglutamic semialdehyde dehydrogenase